MRATSMRRLLGGAAALMLVGTTLLTAAGSVLGADTRKIYVGSDPTFAPESNGVLTFSEVTAGGTSASTVHVKNIDNQTLTHVVITIAREQGSATVSDDVFGPNAGSCSASATAITCDFGNLKARATRSFSILLDTPSSGTISVLAKIVFNESNNENGGNQQIEQATGDLVVVDGGCDLARTFLRAGHPASVATTCALGAGNTQSTRIATTVTSDSPVKVGEESTGLCSGSLGCFGDLSVADVTIDGTYTVTWTIQWQVASNFNVQKFGVLHFPDGSSSPDLNLTYKKNLCKTATATGCIESVTLEGTTLTAVIRTRGNGSMRGFN